MKRGITKTKTRQLEKDIPDINLDNTLKVDHVNMFCNSLTDNLTRIVEKYTMKMKHLQKKTRLPWLNSEIFKLMKKRDLAPKVALSGGLSTDFLIYKGLRKEVSMVLRKAKTSYYSLTNSGGQG